MKKYVMLVILLLVIVLPLSLFFLNLNTNAVERPTVAITVNADSYTQGTTVYLTIDISHANDEFYWLYVDGPDGHNILFKGLGQVNGSAVFNEEVEIPLEASVGTYTIIVTWDHTFVKTIFEVTPIPEFPIAAGIALFAALLISLVILRRRKEKN